MFYRDFPKKRNAGTVPVYMPVGTFKADGWTVSGDPVRFEGNGRGAQYHGVYNRVSKVFLHMSRTQLAAILFEGNAIRDKHHSCKCK